MNVHKSNPGLPRSLICLITISCSILPLASGFAQAQPGGSSNVPSPTEVLNAYPSPQAITSTAQKPSQNGLTVPSLWWTNEQYGNKLVDDWVVYAQNSRSLTRVDLVVRRGVWNLLNYYDRYAAVNHFGTAVSDYGYNLLIFDRQQNFLAAYTCDFSNLAPDFLKGARDAQGRPVPNYIPAERTANLACQLWLNPRVRNRKV